MPNGYKNTIEVFWAWVPPDDPDERVCTPWQGPRFSPNGYGQFSNQLGMSRYAHRAIYEIRHGKITDSLLVLHSCDFRPCMRDSHHWLGTQEDNMKDMAAKGRGRGFKPIGEKNPKAILTETEVLAIRDLASKGASKWILADVFKVSADVVYCIVARRTWTHI